MGMGERTERGLSNGNSPSSMLSHTVNLSGYSESELCPRRGEHVDSTPIAMHGQFGRRSLGRRVPFSVKFSISSYIMESQ